MSATAQSTPCPRCAGTGVDPLPGQLGHAQDCTECQGSGTIEDRHGEMEPAEGQHD